MRYISEPVHSPSKNFGNAPADAQNFGLSQSRDWNPPAFGDVGSNHSENFADAYDLPIATIAQTKLHTAISPPFGCCSNPTVRRAGLSKNL
ncbi:hypothetical protein [Burkholderia cepacia]|uniref:hypothetical protein n=1 Tax=Burkholderia cepacia TaxID=292 RepID=UPI0021AB1966|nr:hypothetical protein [Burkholderia cepacia]